MSPCDLDLWPLYPKIYTAVLQVIIYQLAKYEKDPMKDDREIGGRRWLERRKITRLDQSNVLDWKVSSILLNQVYYITYHV